MNAMRGPATVRGGSSGQQRAAGTDLPLKCICNLCSCGGHRCADFNLWANGGDSSDQDQQRYSSLAHSTDGDNENGGVMESSHNHKRNEMSPRCDQCDEERYLTTSVTRGRTTTPGQQGEEHRQRYARSPAPTNGNSEEQNEKQVDEVEQEQKELLHVLVTRPEIASKPRDNILFEGDMDLRTTFETSYEALARMRLEHWKSHQAQQQQQQHGDQLQASESKLPHEINGTQHVSDQASAASGKNGAASEHQLELTRADAHHDRDNDVQPHHGRSGGDGLKGARMIKSPARLRGGDSLVGTGLALGQVQHRDQLLMQREHRQHARDLNSPSAAAAAVARGHTGRVSAAGESQSAAQQNQAKHCPTPAQQNREQSSPFVDPDLSPIIVYDANLNRLERVGLRKRSKYRPSTSLRPGGRAGFFGQSLDGEGLCANGQPEHEEKAQAEREDESQLHRQMATVSPGGEFCLHDGAAGDTSENLNRNKMAGGDRCGRKHNLGHVNRVDHIKQFNLVENTDPHMREFRDKATLTEREQTRIEQQKQQQPYKEPAEHQQVIDGTAPQAAAALATDEWNLALADEEAAVAEIQKVTSLGPDSGHDGRNARDTRIAQTHGSAAAADIGPEAASPARPNSNDYSATSPLVSTGDRLAASSRQARMQRVCQNQSFNIHENEYPEVKEGKLTSCIKIGGRDTVDLTQVNTSGGPSRQSMTSPQAGGGGPSVIIAGGRGSGGNLFRESPDFILTTTGGRGRAADQHHPRKLEGAVEEDAASGLVGRTRTKSVSRNSNLHVGFDGEDDPQEQAGHESAASGGGCFKCRVLDLGHDFEFVGSRSGHKYFLERHLNEEEAPISEMT